MDEYYDQFFTKDVSEADKDNSIIIMKQNGCVPSPSNCANCNNDCHSMFHPQMIADEPEPEIG